MGRNAAGGSACLAGGGDGGSPFGLPPYGASDSLTGSIAPVLGIAALVLLLKGRGLPMAGLIVTRTDAALANGPSQGCPF